MPSAVYFYVKIGRRSIQIQTRERMKNVYISIPFLMMALAAGTTVSAQSAKPRPEKQVQRVKTMVRGSSASAVTLEYRGGANDECETAIPVTVTPECSGSLATYDATAATQSLDPILCNGFTSPEANDLWFSFMATSGVTNVTVEGTASFDAVIEGFSGACGALSSVGCADATFPTAGENTTETLTMSTTIGETYYVRVYTYWAPVPVDFTFTLCIFEGPDAPENDLCTSVTPADLMVGGTVSFTGDNTGALDTEGLGAPNVWHAFTLDAPADIVLDYCGTDPAFGNAFLNLWSGCPADSNIPTAVFDITTCPDGNVTMVFSNVCPGTYYYAVMNDAVNGAVGAYTVNVAAIAIAPGYCAASADACDEIIAQVTVGTIDNISDCLDGDVVDYTALSTDIEQGETVAITVLNGPTIYTADAVSVWVDWNQDESFCQENEEFMLVSDGTGAIFTGSITAPADALLGPTRMRVRMAWNEVPAACGGADWGEVEDYTVNVTMVTGIGEFQSLDWSVFPNPSNGNMTVRYAGVDAKVVIELVDVSGRTVHQEQRQLFNGQQADLGLAGTLASGMYTLRLSTPEGRAEQRVVVK